MIDPKTEGLARIGTVVLDRFRLDQLIGTGGYAFAYACVDLVDQRPAVVKVAQRAVLYGGRGGEVRRRFEAEGRAASRVEHPNLPRIYATGHTPEGIPAIAMEMIEGELLEDRLLLGGLDFDAWDACFGQLGDALVTIHRVGVIHRDITPRNIIWSLRPDGTERPVLLDFGIAKLDQASLGTIGALGTPGFMAPEQILGQATPRSDVFALGALLWWASTGHAFLSRFHSIEDLFGYQMGERDAPDPREIDGDMPRDLAELISATLAPRVEDRIGAEEFVDRWAWVVATARGRWQPRPPGYGDLEPDLEGIGPTEVKTLVQRPAKRRTAEVVVVSDDAMVTRLVAAHVRGLGRDVVVSPNPEISGQHKHVTDAVFIVATDLSGVDGYEVAEQLRTVHPKARVFLVSRKDEGSRWLSTSAHEFFVLPSDLERLGLQVQAAFEHRFREGGTSPPIPINRATIDALVHRSSAPEVADRIERFVSSLPHQISSVVVSLGRDDAEAQAACNWLSTQASTFGADRLADLAQVIHALIGDGDLDNANRLLADVRSEHERVQSALLLARGQLLGAQ